MLNQTAATNTSVADFESSITAPRWSRIERELLECAAMHKLACAHTVTKRFLKLEVRFSVRGNSDSVDNFIIDLDQRLEFGNSW